VATLATTSSSENASEEVVRDDGIVGIGQTHALPIDIPEEIMIHQVRGLRCLDEKGALHGGDIVHHISRDTRVLVAEIQPDGIAALDARHAIVPHQGPAATQQFDPGHFPVKLGVLPPAIDDIVVFDQALARLGRAFQRCRNRRCDSAARCCDPGWELSAGERPSFIGPPPRVDSHRIDMPHRIPFDDPGCPPMVKRAATPERVKPLAQCSSVNPLIRMKARPRVWAE